MASDDGGREAPRPGGEVTDRKADEVARFRPGEAGSGDEATTVGTVRGRTI